MSASVLSRGLATIAAFLFLGGEMTALADTGDPPGRVGRLSYMEGAVSFHAADQEQWSPATLNYPVTSGASFWTEPDARAEIQVGAMELRMDHASEIDVAELDDSHTRVQLQQGIVNVHVREVPPGGVVLEAPDVSISLFQPGRYRLEAVGTGSPGSAGEVRLAVLEGYARLDTTHGSLDLHDGKGAVVAGEPPTIRLQDVTETPFDEWARSRENSEAASEAERYVSPDMTGYQDLDSYGSWQTVPTYGAVWFPAVVPAGWAPYRFGHWAFIPPWGWVWVDDAPWGFAPFHFGRWAFIDGRWAWCPGVRVRRPVFAPALVVFLGGSHWGVPATSIGVRGPAVGWVPLAPFEVFRPSFRTSATFLRRVNASSVDRRVADRLSFENLGNVSVARLKNRRIATVVTSQAFIGAAPVHRALLAVPEEQISHAPVSTTLTHLRPTPVARVGIAAPVGREQPAEHPRTTPHTTLGVPSRTSGAPALAPAAAPVPKAPGPPFTTRARPATIGPSTPLHRLTPSMIVPPSEPRVVSPPRVREPSVPRIREPSTVPPPVHVVPAPRPIPPRPAPEARPPAPPTMHVAPPAASVGRPPEPPHRPPPSQAEPAPGRQPPPGARALPDTRRGPPPNAPGFER